MLKEYALALGLSVLSAAAAYAAIAHKDAAEVYDASDVFASRYVSSRAERDAERSRERIFWLRHLRRSVLK